MHNIDHYFDVALVLYVTINFALMTIAMILPTRRPDSLSKALVVLFSLFTVVYMIGVAQAFEWLPLPLPDWARWAIRLSYIPAQTVVLVRLFKDGAFHRHGKDA